MGILNKNQELGGLKKLKREDRSENSYRGNSIVAMVFQKVKKKYSRKYIKMTSVILIVFSEIISRFFFLFILLLLRFFIGSICCFYNGENGKSYIVKMENYL